MRTRSSLPQPGIPRKRRQVKARQRHACGAEKCWDCSTWSKPIPLGRKKVWLGCCIRTQARAATEHPKKRSESTCTGEGHSAQAQCHTTPQLTPTHAIPKQSACPIGQHARSGDPSRTTANMRHDCQQHQGPDFVVLSAARSAILNTVTSLTAGQPCTHVTQCEDPAAPAAI